MKKEAGLSAIFAAIFANALWGSTFMASKVVLAQCPPLSAVLVRFSIALAVFATIAILKRADFQADVLKDRRSDATESRRRPRAASIADSWPQKNRK